MGQASIRSVSQWLACPLHKASAFANKNAYLITFFFPTSFIAEMPRKYCSESERPALTA